MVLPGAVRDRSGRLLAVFLDHYDRYAILIFFLNEKLKYYGVRGRVLKGRGMEVLCSVLLITFRTVTLLRHWFSFPGKIRFAPWKCHMNMENSSS